MCLELLEWDNTQDGIAVLNVSRSCIADLPRLL